MQISQGKKREGAQLYVVGIMAQQIKPLLGPHTPSVTDMPLPILLPANAAQAGKAVLGGQYF